MRFLNLSLLFTLFLHTFNKDFQLPGRAENGLVKPLGPLPRSYRVEMPRKMRRLALRSALSLKAGLSQVVVMDMLSVAAPKTKDMVAVLDNLQAAEKTLILLADRDVNVELSARNIQGVKTVRADSVSVVDVLQHDTLIVPVGALDVLHRMLG